MANKSENGVGRPLQYESKAALQVAIDDYFETKAKVDMGEYISFQPTMAGLALHLGLSRQGLLNYEGREEFVDAIKRARMRVEEALEQRLYGNAPTGAIFNLKNNFGWKDKQELDHQSSDGSMATQKPDNSEVAKAISSIAEKL